MGNRTARKLGIIIYAALGLIAWGRFIAQGCFAEIGGKCVTPTARAAVGPIVAAFWPVYVAELYFEKASP